MTIEPLTFSGPQTSVDTLRSFAPVRRCPLASGGDRLKRSIDPRELEYKTVEEIVLTLLRR